MASMRVAQVPKPGGALEVVERQIPERPPGSVRVQVQACGICHSDALVKNGWRTWNSLVSIGCSSAVTPT
jgi:D-arabinose 1-dehydrogenase-like Zn-dependent alcohol dehydrogenase